MMDKLTKCFSSGKFFTSMSIVSQVAIVRNIIELVVCHESVLINDHVSQLLIMYHIIITKKTIK